MTYVKCLLTAFLLAAAFPLIMAFVLLFFYETGPSFRIIGQQVGLQVCVFTLLYLDVIVLKRVWEK